MKYKIVISIIIVICLGISLYSKEHQTEKIAVNEFAKGNSTINGNNYKYNNPVIPAGFKAIEEGASWSNKNGIISGWNQGLVIEDEIGNQFVWVPVKDGIQSDGLYNKDDINTVAYKKWRIYNQEDYIVEGEQEYFEELIGEKINNLTISSEDIKEDSLPTGIKSEGEQIRNYGGFYIARYEAGFEEEDLKEIYSLNDEYDFIQVNDKNNTVQYIPISKVNSQVWNFIEYEKAKEISKQMYQTEQVRSGLMTGRQFDTIMRWAEVTGYSLDNTTTWGNFLDTTGINYTGRYASYLRKKSEDWKIKDYGIKENENMIFTGTGGVKEAKMNEIYDIVGNLFEFTTDLYKGKVAMVRGGSAGYSGSNTEEHPAIGYSFGDALHYIIGFRVVLYIDCGE